MDKIFVDSDVILDFLTDREPHSHFSSQLFVLSESKEIGLTTSSLCINNIYYIIRKIENHKSAINIIRDLCSLMEIQSVGVQEIKDALASDFSDFEDAIQYYTSLKDSLIKAIVTRNIKDYKNAKIAILTPETFIKSFSKE